MFDHLLDRALPFLLTCTIDKCIDDTKTVKIITIVNCFFAFFDKETIFKIFQN